MIEIERLHKDLNWILFRLFIDFWNYLVEIDG